ncbi:MAG: hypothetical protein ACI31S_02535 [Bacilli bacterium]
MIVIPEDIKKDVQKVVNHLIVYKNTQRLSWLSAYKEVLIILKMEDKLDNDRFLNNVVKEITNQGYDIIGSPFELKRFK